MTAPARNNQYGLASERLAANLIPQQRGNWRSSAACTDTDPEIFFAGRGSDDEAHAKRICGACPVRTQCLTWALAQPTGKMAGLQGIWGGSTLEDRGALRRVGISDGAEAALLLDMNPVVRRAIRRMRYIRAGA